MRLVVIFIAYKLPNKVSTHLKSQLFFQHFFSSSFVAEIGNWLELYNVKKTGEHDVEDCIRIELVEVE